MTIQNNTGRQLFSLSVLLCGTFLGTSAVAQTSSSVGAPVTGDNSVVVVTARKQSENVQTIPESITAIDARTIVAAHLTTLDDFNSLVTNLNITQRADNTPDAVIRGVGTFGVVQGVGFYVNDVQQFEGQSVRPDDIERIEVLKGPQGTLFGGSNVGGAIKYVTKLPTNTLTGDVTLGYGEYNDRTVDAAISGPIVADKLLVRLSGFVDATDGFQFDPIFNRRIGRSNETSGRLTLEYLGDRTKVLFYLTGDHVNSENMNLYYPAADDQTYDRNYYGGVDGLVPFYHRNLYSPTLSITHDFGGVQLSSISSYFHSSVRSEGNFDKGAVNLLYGVPIYVDFPQDFGKSVWSQDLRLSSTGSSAFKWSLGVFVQQINTNTVQILSNGLATTVGSPVGLIPDVLGPTTTTAYRHENRDFALYGNASYDLGNWTFEAGLRATNFDNRMVDTGGPGAGPSNCQPGECSGEKRESALLPKVSVDYHFSKDLMGYVTVARGDQEGDFSDNSDGAVNHVKPYNTEYALSFEGGLKSQFFDRRLTLNGAAFYIDYTNRIFEVGAATAGGIYTYNANVGSSRNYGFELEAVARPTPEFSVTGGLGVTRAVFGAASIADGNTPPNILSTNGHAGPNTPAYQATLAIDWRHHLTDSLVLGARVDSRFVGKSYWDAAGCAAAAVGEPGCPYAGADSIQRPYQVVNAGASLDFGQHWSAAFHIENLFDVRYNTFFAAGGEIGAPYNVAGINRPRQWSVSLTARY